jgi:hypothetical protein
MVVVEANLIEYLKFIQLVDHTIAQAVSCQLPTTAAQFEAMSGHVGFMVDKMALG